jgi:hypothetical protein
MAAPKGNQYYKLRSKDGRSKIFDEKNQDIIVDEAIKYINHLEDNPVIVKEMIRSGEKAGTLIDVTKPRIPSVRGFCVWLGIDSRTFANYQRNENYKDFFQTFQYVSDIFDNILQEEGLTGNANPAIAAMLLNLKSKHDVTSENKAITGITVNIIDPETAKDLNEE